MIVDSSEQVIERPSSYQDQKQYYSGKQKKHTLKNQFVVLPKRILVEHLIRVVKIFKIVQERFRLDKSRYQSVLLAACGLVRLRIGSFFCMNPSPMKKQLTWGYFSTRKLGDSKLDTPLTARAATNRGESDTTQSCDGVPLLESL